MTAKSMMHWPRLWTFLVPPALLVAGVYCLNLNQYIVSHYTCSEPSPPTPPHSCPILVGTIWSPAGWTLIIAGIVLLFVQLLRWGRAAGVIAPVEDSASQED